MKQRDGKYTRFKALCEKQGLNLVNTFCLIVPNDDAEQRKLVADLVRFKHELNNLYFTQ